MAGMIGAGQAYSGKALSGFIRESAQKAQIDLANKQNEEAEKAQGMSMAVQGGVVGYKSAPAIAGMLAPAATAANGLATGATGAGLTSALVPAAVDASVVGAGTAGLLEAGAVSAGVPIAAEAAGAAVGAEAGAAAGLPLGPVGIIAGAGLGYLLSRLF